MPPEWIELLSHTRPLSSRGASRGCPATPIRLKGFLGFSSGDANYGGGATWSPRWIAACGSIAPVDSIDGGYRIDCQSAFHFENRPCAYLLRASLRTRRRRLQ